MNWKRSDHSLFQGTISISGWTYKGEGGKMPSELLKCTFYKYIVCKFLYISLAAILIYCRYITGQLNFISYYH